MKKAVFMLSTFFIANSSLLASPADLLTNQDVQEINKAYNWCLDNNPPPNSMDGRRCHVITTYPKTALDLVATISNKCQSGEVNR